MNILLVFADQMRGQDMACAGNVQVRTPHLDRLAAGGTMMRRAYSNYPVCTPARGSLLMGCYPLRHRAFLNDLPIRTDLPSLGTLASQAGAAAGYIGKWHLDGVPRAKFTPPGPRRLGFDHYWAVHNCTHSYMNSFCYTQDAQPIPIPTYEPEYQTDLALAFLENNKDKPFCLVLSYGTPHNPYDRVPERYQALYPPEQIQLRPNVPPDRAEQARKDIAGYYAHITALDEYVGKLLDKLDALQLAEQTLVVFTSDHGDMLHSLGRTRKQQPYEESISIPLIFRQGGTVPAGAVRDELIGLLDIAPTILGLAGLRVSETMQGKDLSAMIHGRGKGREAILLADFCPVDEAGRLGVVEWRGLRTARHTYARDIRGPWVLYDNQADPCQQHNLVDDPAHEPLRRQLEQAMQAALREVDDDFAPWQDYVRRYGLAGLWNARERELHKDKGNFLAE